MLSAPLVIRALSGPFRRHPAAAMAALALAAGAAWSLAGARPVPDLVAPLAAAPAAGGQAATSVDDQVDMALTVYNGQIALVRDVRHVALGGGELRLQFSDIASTVNPATVHVRSLTDPSALRVLEQNYEYDLLDPQKLLQKYVGREVTLVRALAVNGTTKLEEVKATLLALNGGPVWKIGDEIVTGMPADHLRFPELPANLYSRPTLVWMLDNRGAPKQRLEVSYLAGGLTWNADYVLTVGRDDRAADLDGWVTLGNTSGAAYRNARLQLVAGDLHRVADGPAGALQAKRALMVAEAAPSEFAQEAFSEYHLYTLGRRTSIENRETKQISLLSATGFPIRKRFIVEGQRFYYHNAQHPGAPIRDAVKVYYTFENEEAAGLGMPLPAGTVRVYQADSKGGVQFIGEDRIDHTPKDETLTLQVGSAFDIVCERKQTDYRDLGRVWEMAFEITLRNHKAGPITVEVDEPIGGDWEMISSSHPWTKTAAWAAQFDVPVTAGGEAVLKYRVRMR